MRKPKETNYSALFYNKHEPKVIEMKALSSNCNPAYRYMLGSKDSTPNDGTRASCLARQYLVPPT